MLQLYAECSYATARLHLPSHRPGHWPLLVVLSPPFSVESGRFQLGGLGCAGPARPPQSLRPCDANVSLACSFLRITLCKIATWSCGRGFLWTQFRTHGLRALAAGLSS